MRMKSGTSESFRTSSLYLAAYLLAEGLLLTEHIRDEAGRVAFVVGGDTERLSDLVRNYRSGGATTNAVRYGAELRRLKGLLYGSD